jgi:hypothetical protein
LRERLANSDHVIPICINISASRHYTTVGRQVAQHNVGRDDEGFGDMGGGVGEHQEVEAISILAAEVIEKDLGGVLILLDQAVFAHTNS